MGLTRDDKIQLMGAARYRCQANGLHHPGCPGEITPETVNRFVIHHRYPRERAKREGYSHVVDGYVNLVIVYNGLTGLGAGGCHGHIHQERRKAEAKGLLLRRMPNRVYWPGDYV